MKPGIKSYVHLNEVIFTILKESGEELSASRINDMILTRYQTNKIHLSARSISKRLRGINQIECREGRPYQYKYVE